MQAVKLADEQGEVFQNDCRVWSPRKGGRVEAVACVGCCYCLRCGGGLMFVMEEVEREQVAGGMRSLHWDYCLAACFG